MSLRERSAWITLVSVLVCSGVYSSSILRGPVNGRGAGAFHVLLLCVAALVALQRALHSLASWLAPGCGPIASGSRAASEGRRSVGGRGAIAARAAEGEEPVPPRGVDRAVAPDDRGIAGRRGAAGLGGGMRSGPSLGRACRGGVLVDGV